MMSTCARECFEPHVHTEALRIFLTGMLTPLLMTGFVNSLLFGMQYNFVGEIARLRGHSRAVLSDTCLAAVASGAIISIIVTPMEGIKARLQVHATQNTILLDCAHRGRLVQLNGVQCPTDSVDACVCVFFLMCVGAIFECRKRRVQRPCGLCDAGVSKAWTQKWDFSRVAARVLVPHVQLRLLWKVSGRNGARFFVRVALERNHPK